MATYAGLGAAAAVFSFALSFALRYYDNLPRASPYLNPADRLLFKLVKLNRWLSNVQSCFTCGSSVSRLLL